MSEKFACVVYKKKTVGTEQGSPLNINNFLQAESSAIAFKFCLIFSFVNDHFLFSNLASVAANHKTATESDLLNNIAGVLKYAHEKIGAEVVER